MSIRVSQFPPFFQGATTALPPLPGTRTGAGGVDMFVAQIPVPGNPDGPPLQPPGGAGNPQGLPPLPGTDNPLLPPLGGLGEAGGPLLPPIGAPLTPLGGSGGTGNRMVLFNQLGLVFRDGPPPCYISRTALDPSNPTALTEDTTKRYYWLPDGSLLVTDNEDTVASRQIITVNGAGGRITRAVVADDDANIAWGRTMALQGGLLPINGGCSYGRGGSATSGEFLLVPGNNGTLSYTGGSLGDPRGVRGASFLPVSGAGSLTAQETNTALFIRRMGLRPRSSSEGVLGAASSTGSRVSINYAANQWVQIPALQSTAASTPIPDNIGGVFTITSPGTGGNYHITQSLQNDPTRPTAYTERNNCPGQIRYTFDPSTAELLPQIQVGTTSDWANLNYINGYFFYIHAGRPYALMRRTTTSGGTVTTTYAWQAPPDGQRTAMLNAVGNSLVPRA